VILLSTVGVTVGTIGDVVGDLVGDPVGFFEGTFVGDIVGFLVGETVGDVLVEDGLICSVVICMIGWLIVVDGDSLVGDLLFGCEVVTVVVD